MKILFVIYSLGTGGAERVMSLLSSDWAEHGYNISIVTLKSSDRSFYKLHNSIEVIPLDVASESHSLKDALLGNYKRMSAIKRVILERNPDIVIAFMTTTNILTILAAKLAKKPVIVSEHNNFYFVTSKLWRLLRKVVYPFSDALIVLTEHDREKYDYHSNVHVVPNPLILEHNYKNIQRQKMILAVGRLQKQKGFDLLLKAFSQVEAKGWYLVILGDGPERANLEKQVDELEINKKISMPGRVTDVESYYKKASIFVLSSRQEGFPMALIEAMGYGCAPVAFDCLTGPSDIIDHNKNGILVEAGNINKLGESIQYLIDQEKKRDELGESAKKIIDELNIETITMKWFKIINKVLDKGKTCVE